MIRVALINHVTRPEEVNEPLGIELLSATLKARFPEQVQIRLVLVESEDHQTQLKKELQAYRPHIIGISSKIGQLRPLLDLYEHSKTLTEPVPFFVVGDQLATLANDQLLIQAPEAICVQGEGEDALSGIVGELIAANGELDADSMREALIQSDVPNCTFIDKGKQLFTRRQTLDLKLAVAPDRQFISQSVDNGWIVHAEASRGCPWSKCAFCYVNHKYQGKSQWQAAPIDAVLSDLENLSEAGARTVFFSDEDFVGPDWKRIWALGDAIIAAKEQNRIHPEMAFFVSATASTLLNHHKKATGKIGAPELLAHLHKAGVRELFLGIESGCDSQLRRYRKGITTEENIIAMDWVRNSGIDLDFGFLPFDPWTTLEELETSLKFLKRAHLVHQPVRVLKKVLLTPGTPLANKWLAEVGEVKIKLNELTLDYEIIDERVASIAKLVDYRWQARASEIYTTQAARRNTLSSEGDERAELTERLSREREDDFYFVERCLLALKTALKTGTEEKEKSWQEALEEVTKADRVLGALTQQSQNIIRAQKAKTKTHIQTGSGNSPLIFSQPVLRSL